MKVEQKEILPVKNEITLVFKEWCETSTSHGLPNIARSKSYLLTSIWIIFFMFSSGYCFYLIVQNLISYLNYPSSTDIQVINEIPALFPAISICNFNPFNTDDPNVVLKLDDILDKHNFSALLNNHTAYEKKRSYVNFLNAHISSFSKEERISLGFKLEDMLVSAYFNGDDLSIDSFEWFYDFNYGNCYRFNSNSSKYKYVGIDGAVSALEVELYIGNSTGNQPFVSERGIRMLVNNNTLKPYPFEDGFSLSPGKRTNIRVEKTLFDRLGPPYSDCQIHISRDSPQKNDIMKIMFDVLNETDYNEKYCIKLCFQIFLHDSCNCSDPSFPSFFKIKCTTSAQIECQEEAFANFNLNPNLYCNKNCPTGKYLNILLSKSYYFNF